MHVVVSGGRGLIGSALTARLRAGGHKVSVLTRSAKGADDITWNPSAGVLDPAALAGADAVVHLAGEPIGDKRWTAEQKRLIVESRATSTTLLATTLAGLTDGPKVLVSGSAIGYYGRDRGDEVLTETSGHGDDFLADLCVQWESATAPAAAAGVRVAHVRTGIVLTSSAGALAKFLPLFRLGLGGKMGKGTQWMSWVSLHDEVSAIEHLLTDDGATGAFNLTGPAPVTNAEFTKTLGKVLKRPTLVPVPAFGPRLLVGRELADNLVFGSQRVLPAALEGRGFTFAHPTLEAALRASI